jgi:predicted RNase H-like nuclease
MRWRLAPREMSVAVGDLTSDYIVAPVSAIVMQRLAQAALKRGVPINALSRPAAAFEHSY